MDDELDPVIRDFYPAWRVDTEAPYPSNFAPNPAVAVLSEGWQGVTPGRLMKTEKSMSKIESAQERLRVALREFAGLQALLDRFSGQEPPVGTVLRWTKQFDGSSGELVLDEAAMRASDQLGRSIRFQVSAPTEYTYIAFRAANGDWYSTAQRGAHRYEWSDLLRDIGDNPCEIATDWTEVPAPAKVEETRLDPIEWARRMFSVPADTSNEDTSR